jgi:hypothetical protein
MRNRPTKLAVSGQFAGADILMDILPILTGMVVKRNLTA